MFKMAQMNFIYKFTIVTTIHIPFVFSFLSVK